MKLDPRIVVPAALAVAAIAIPTGTAGASNGGTLQCPDNYVLVPSFAMPTKDKNNDGFVCMKVTPGNTPVIDDNCQCDSSGPFSTNPDDYVDDIIS